MRAPLGDVFFGVRCSCPDGRGKEPNGKESGSAPWQWKGQGDQSEDDEGQAASKLILTEGNPWLTPTESCATEQEEERLVRAPLASDPTRDTTCTVPVRWARERGEPLAPKLQTNEI